MQEDPPPAPAGRATDRGERCPSCGSRPHWEPRFQQAFPDHFVTADEHVSAFPLSEPAPVAAWLMAACDVCGAVSPRPYPSRSAVEGYYADAAEPSEWEVDHYVRLDRNPKALAGADRMARQLTRLAGGPASLLEVGCAAGWVLRAGRDRGWKVKGVEAAPKFSGFAREHLGLDVFAGRVDHIRVSEWPAFDVIIGFDVFEHLYDPAADLATLRQLVAPHGWLVFTTPNIESWCARRYGLRWRQIVVSHLNYSTPRSIARILHRSGWRLERISEPRYWDPNPLVELCNRAVEVGKFGLRRLLAPAVAAGEGDEAVRRLPAQITAGHVTWNDVSFRVGTQAVLGDVMLVVARPA